MFRLLNTGTALIALLILAVCASPAPAAKGVKKNGEHHLRGTIVAVKHNKNGNGTMTVRVTHHKQKKNQTALNQTAPRKHAHHTFTINNRTQVNGTAKGRTGIGALHRGEHVTVAAHHHHADRVTIHHPHKNKKKIAKG